MLVVKNGTIIYRGIMPSYDQMLETHDGGMLLPACLARVASQECLFGHSLIQDTELDGSFCFSRSPAFKLTIIEMESSGSRGSIVHSPQYRRLIQCGRTTTVYSLVFSKRGSHLSSWEHLVGPLYDQKAPRLNQQESSSHAYIRVVA